MLAVNDELIPRERIRDQAAGLRQQHRQREGRGLSLEEEAALSAEAEHISVDQVLLEQYARSAGLDVSEEEIEQALLSTNAGTRAAYTCMDAGAADEALRAEVRSHLLRQKLLQSLPGSQSPSKKEVSEFYKRHRSSFWTPELIRVSQIVRNVDEMADAAVIENEMNGIRRELVSGADFAALADSRSDCKGNGGDLGYFPRGQMVEEFDEAVFSLKVGELSGVFRTRFGFHLAIVRDRKAEGIRLLEEVYETAESACIRRKQDRELGELLAALRAKAVIRRISRAEASR